MAGASTTIGREILEIDLKGTESEGLRIQRLLSAAHGELVVAVLEAAFEAHDPGDVCLRIDRLAIQLSVGSSEQFEHELASSLRQEIDAWFARHIGAASEPAGDDSNVRRHTPTDRAGDLLVRFLASGRLTYPDAVAPGTSIEDAVLGRPTAGLGSEPHLRLSAPTIVALRAELRRSSARERLVLQLSEAFVAAIVEQAAPNAASEVERCLAALGARLPSTLAQAFVRRLWACALAHDLEGRAVAPTDLAGAAWRSMAAGERTPGLQAVLDVTWPGVTSDDVSSDVAGAELGQAPQEAPAKPARVRFSSPIDSPMLEAGSGLAPNEMIAVGNAGMVLLHPFLGRFFSNVGVATDDHMTDPDRALLLLHHLATGESTAAEHQLTLAKVLCGVPLDQPVPIASAVSAIEAGEAGAMLEAAIGYWSALRNTSPDSLRVEFLMRPGEMTVGADGDWELRVAPATADVLLDQLPWGISMLRLPWMHRMMRVEWR